jgi:hypothetical protein
MRIFISVIASLILGLCNIAFADGPPVDSKGKITTDYFAIHIDSAQIEQASRTWAIELTKEQIVTLQKLNKKMSVNVLDILTFPYNDCTCGMFIYGIWNKKDSVSIPLYFIKDYKSYYNDLEPNQKKYYNKRTMKDVIKKLSSTSIFIDFDCNCYIKNKLVTDKDIKKLIDKLSKKKSSKHSGDDQIIWFNTVPFLDKKIEKNIRKKVAKFKAYCKKKNIDCGYIF